ncbi:hypothetical protein Tco_0141978, partial [Tanacetum coccineum]
VGGGDNNDEYVDEDGVNNTDVNNEDVDVDINVDIFDPRNWDSLNSDMIKRLVEQRV